MADIDKANPLDAATISGFPANERSSRSAIETILDLEHDGDGTTATGRHKFGRGSVSTRDAITNWETGSLWINTDVTPNALQMNVGTQATPSWINVQAAAVITTRGDIIRGDSSGVAERLALGTSGQFPRSDGTDVAWSAILAGDLPAASDSAVGAIEIAIQSEMEAASSATLAVTPGRLRFDPSIAKAWVNFTVAGSVNASHNITSITDNAQGDWSVNIATDMSGTSYAVFTTNQDDLLGGLSGAHISKENDARTKTAGVFHVATYDLGSFALEDPSGNISASAFGDQ